MTLIVAGSGDQLDEAKLYAGRKGYSDIEFAGEVSGAAKARLLEACHVMVFPTYYGEGLPNCILEGMLYGMPIVSRVNGAIPEVVKHDVNGFLTENTDSSSFARYMFRLVRNAQLYRTMAITNHRVAQDAFATEKVRERLLGIYREMEVQMTRSW
jgi:glycosyltransferase involved in cell wall biosynthesis